MTAPLPRLTIVDALVSGAVASAPRYRPERSFARRPLTVPRLMQIGMRELHAQLLASFGRLTRRDIIRAQRDELQRMSRVFLSGAVEHDLALMSMRQARARIECCHEHRDGGNEAARRKWKRWARQELAAAREHMVEAQRMGWRIP